jgi:hypothetical protein
MEMDKSVLEIKNIKYWESFYNFFKRLFFFFNKMPKELIPKEDEFYLKIGDQGEIISESKPAINFVSFIKDNIDIIIEWPEYTELSNNAIFLSAVGAVFEDKNNFHLNNNYIRAIASILYKKFNYSFKFKKKLAFNQYMLVENYIYSDDLLFVVKTPIYNLEIEKEVIKIGNDIYLKKIEEADLNLFNPPFMSYGHGMDYLLSSCKTIIETENKIKKGEALWVGIDTISNINKTISSLSVYKKNTIGIGPIFSKPKNFWSMFSGIHSSSMPNDTYIHYNKSILEKKDIRPFRMFWKKYNDSAKKNPWLDLAGRRLLRMFYKMRIEDQFVDLMIIFEILFLPKGNAELKYRLSIIVASLLGKSFKEKMLIYKLFKVSYDIRSSIVHDGFVSPQKEKQLKKLGLNINELYKKLQYYLFKSIEIFTKNPDIRDNFEDIIFR